MTYRVRKILTRHNCASHTEFLYYAQSLPMRYLRQTLDRSERTITEWLNGTRVIPPWAVAVLRLQHLEHELLVDQMCPGRKRQPEPAQPIDHRHFPAANDSLYTTVSLPDLTSRQPKHSELLPPEYLASV